MISMNPQKIEQSVHSNSLSVNNEREYFFAPINQPREPRV